MAAYKLTYFPFRARAEVIRLIFAQTGVEYENERLPFLPSSAEWQAKKKSLAGKTSLDSAELEGIVDTLEDGWCAVFLANFLQKNNELKEEKCKELYETVLPNLFSQVDALIKKNGQAAGWIWGDQLTYADLAIYHLFSHFVSRDDNALSRYPRVSLLYHSVEQQPNIAEWISERPQDII